MEQDNNKIIVEHREMSKLTDSLEIGTPSKMGCIKLYTDFSDLDATKKRIDNALEARRYMQGKIGGVE